MDGRSDAFKAGLDLRREMFGPAGADDAVNNATDLTRPLQEIVTEFCFGQVWQREGLTHRERSMITVALLIGSGRMMQLPAHLRGALANGMTRDELRELVLHSLLYVGIPASVEAIAALEKVLAE